MVGTTASFCLTAGEEVVQPSASRTINIAWINGEGKENSAYLFVGSAEPLLIPSVTASETTYVFVQNCHGINVIDTVQAIFVLFSLQVFIFPYDCPLEPLLRFFHPQLAILPFILSQLHSATWFRSPAKSPSSHSFSLGLYQVITACSCISLKPR